MSHEIVSRLNSGVLEFLFAYAGAAGWHGLGSKISDFDEAVTYCEFNRDIRIEDLVAAPSGIKIPNRRAVLDNHGRVLGTVGPDYQVHQDTDLCKLARSYLETGLVEFDTCGMLLGGSRIWISLKVKDSEVDICPGDPIKTNLFLAQGHDMTLAVVQGYSDIRIVCNNTLTMGLREQDLSRVRHQGQVVKKCEEAAEDIRKLLESRASRVEVYQALARKDCSGKEVVEFANALSKKGDKEAGERANSLKTKILEKFAQGIGGRAQTWWDVLNAVTELTTHGLGNEMKDDAPGDREGRALNKMFFGASAKLNERALELATKMAA